jgi:hypothetical protein
MRLAPIKPISPRPSDAQGNARQPAGETHDAGQLDAAEAALSERTEELMDWPPTVPPLSRTSWRPSALAPLAMATDAIRSSLTKVASIETQAHHPSMGRDEVDRTRRHAVSSVH